MTELDPLAEFADRDRATRDAIATALHRSYTRPSPYPTYGDELRDDLAAHQARCELLLDMAMTTPYGSVLYGVLTDALSAAHGHRAEAEKRLAD